MFYKQGEIYFRIRSFSIFTMLCFYFLGFTQNDKYDDARLFLNDIQFLKNDTDQGMSFNEIIEFYMSENNPYKNDTEVSYDEESKMLSVVFMLNTSEGIGKELKWMVSQVQLRKTFYGVAANKNLPNNIFMVLNLYLTNYETTVSSKPERFAKIINDLFYYTSASGFLQENAQRAKYSYVLRENEEGDYLDSYSKNYELFNYRVGDSYIPHIKPHTLVSSFAQYNKSEEPIMIYTEGLGKVKLAGDDYHMLYSKVVQPFLFDEVKKTNLDRYKINNKDIRDIDTYSLIEMVEFFIEDCRNNNINIAKQNIKATFEVLSKNLLAYSSGIRKDGSVVISVNPKSWSEADLPTKWYIMYHELGHDILNLEHGEGGKMMFNYSNEEHTWDGFFEDKKTMFEFYNKWN